MLLLVLMCTTRVFAEEAANTTAPADSTVTETKDPPTKVETKNPEKRGLVRVTAVHGAVDNQQPYQVVYAQPTLQQVAYTQQSPQYEASPKTATGLIPSKYDFYNNKQYTTGYSAQPTYQQQYVLPSPYPSQPLPYTAGPTTMLLLMTPPHPGNPYGSLMLIPAGGNGFNFFPQYHPNQILNYSPTQSFSQNPFFQTQPRFTYVPQYVPSKSVPQMPNQNAGYAAAQQLIYKLGEYPQKAGYQEQQLQQSAEEQDRAQSTSTPSMTNYGNRVRPLEQYVKG